MSKNIIYFADGTWNGPGQTDDQKDVATHTNVYKLFLGLEGGLSPESMNLADEQEKSVISSAGEMTLVAKYIHGVGDSRNPIHKLFGGAFGSGVIKRIVRGHTFISRNYEAGDRIFIIGFSRGAYTARALAGLIVNQGLLRKDLTQDKEQAYKLSGAAWYQYRKSAKKENILSSLGQMIADLPAFLSQKNLKTEDLVQGVSIECVAVFDTVGAMGFPSFDDDKKMMDTFRFADLDLSSKVKHGLHALALDEMREIFSPTLWNDRDQVIQELFPGAHADVGGGYPTTDNESGLSDVTYHWMKNHLEKLNVQFSLHPDLIIMPDAMGIAHKEWLQGIFSKTPIAPRQFPQTIKDKSIDNIQPRLGKSVKWDPSEPLSPYHPTNWL